MIPSIVERIRRLSWVGALGSLTLHGLFVVAVWFLAGASARVEPPDADVALIRLVSSEPGKAARATPPRSMRRATPVKTAPRVAAARPAAVPPVVPPTPMPVPSPPPAADVASAVTPPVATPPAVEPGEPPISGPTIVSAPPEVARAPEPQPELPAPAEAAPPVDAVAPAPQVEAQAVAPVPVEAGPEEGRAVALQGPAAGPDLAELQALTANATVTARAQAEPFVARREVFEFLLDNLEFAAHVTRALRVARYRAWRTADGLMVDDGAGARMNVSIVQATAGTRVVHARVQYRQKLLPEIHCTAVVMIEYDTIPSEDGRDIFSAAVTSYVKVESSVIAALVKLASTAVTDKAALESRRLVRNFARVSRAIEQDPARVLAEVSRDPDVPQAELAGFRKLLGIN